MNGSTPRHLTVLTGASRGLGQALARRLLAPDQILLCLSRHSDDDLAHRASACGAHLEQWVQDLAEPAEAAERLARWLLSLHPPSLASATLINNAGMIPAIGPLHDCPADALRQALRVGLETPMQLTSVFLRQTQAWVEAGWTGPRKVLNISSGLGRRAMASQAPYCAAKAGLDHFSRCVALEQAPQALGARIVSLAPGVIDTDMQAQLRQADARGFPDRERFVALQRQGLLSSPDHTAQQVLAYLAQPAFGTEAVDDVRG
jgi:benzil reductase ((S)-benzoin forming)